MQTDSLFGDDVCSQDLTVVHGNFGRGEARQVPMEIVIPGATSLFYEVTNPDSPTSVEVPAGVGLAKIPFSVPTRKTPQKDPWKGLLHGPAPQVEVPGSSQTRPREQVTSPVPSADPLESSVADDILRETREKKATKSDKDPVPTYLWEEHLVADGPSPWSDKE